MINICQRKKYLCRCDIQTFLKYYIERATDRTYRKSEDGIKISCHVFFNRKHLCGELFSKITFISSAVFQFSQNLQKLTSRQKADPWEKLTNYTSLASSYGTMGTTVVWQIISSLNHPFRYLHL